MSNSKNVRIVTILAVVVLAAECLYSSEVKGNGVTMEFVRIPAGEFMMGSPVGEVGRRINEGPQHRVKLTKPFYMLTTEVTQQQYIQIMGSNPSVFKGTNNPVEMVSWNDAVEFCHILSEKTGRLITLPTEAQWEYACRAGTDTKFCFGEDDRLLDSYCWYKANSSNTTHPVAMKKPNVWGLYDMHGNVQEWCSDHFNYRYYSISPGIDPNGPTNGEPDLRVFRGGSHAYVPNYCRSAIRSGSSPDDLGGILGFRVVFFDESKNKEKTICIILATEAEKGIIKSKQEHGFTINGVVKDPMGLPLDDVEMRIVPFRNWILQQYAKGKFEAIWRPREPNTLMQGYHIIARHKNHNLAVGMEIKEDMNEFDVTLKPGVILTGKVMDSNGKAIEGARVVTILQDSNWPGGFLDFVEADDDGGFEFRALPTGYGYLLSAQCKGYRRDQIEVHPNDVHDNRIDGVSIVLPSGEFSVSGVVVDAKGKPVPNVWVYCTGKGQAGINSRTDANGKFKADGIFEGQVEIIANIKGDNGRWLSGSIKTEAGATDVKVMLGTGGAPPPKGRTCFPADIDVWINGEIVLISDVVVGQTVGEYGCSVPEAAFGQIEKVEEHEGTFECRDVLLENGNRVGVVDAHCFMLGSGKWIAAQDLRNGQRLRTLNGAVTIKSVTIREKPYVGKVFNLKIQNSDRYIIGKDGVIVRDY